jgi:hypothetical protein
MYRYFHNGKELKDGDTVTAGDKSIVVYATADNDMGTDATNPAWIKSGRATACEYGIYPLTADDMREYGITRREVEGHWDKLYNRGNDCDACKSQYLCGRDGDATACKRADNGMECLFEEG